MKRRKKEEEMKVLKIDGIHHEGLDEIIKGVQKKMEKDLGPFQKEGSDEEIEKIEERFLRRVKKFGGNEEEVEKLEKDIEEDELEEIWKKIKMDSSPGEDGVTYRAIKGICSYTKGAKIFLRAANKAKIAGDWGDMECVVNMILLNKKKATDDFSGKRKISKFNKDVNLIGKMWSERFMNIVLPRTLPKTQFCCSTENNITKENILTRKAIDYLKNEGGEENDGTMVAIDYKDAFRSTSHEWLGKIIEKMGLPEGFKKWFWTFYKNLRLKVIINGYETEEIKVMRGVCEGSSPSMPAFVAAIAPVMEEIESKIEGIRTKENEIHSIYGFADDQQVFLRRPEEIKVVQEIVQKFEKISGFQMHRDPKKGKCQALSFGEHKNYIEWPDWVSVREEVQVIGIWYTNVRGKTNERLNTEKILQKIRNNMKEMRGHAGNLLEKAYYVNTFLMSKVWYAAQSMNLDAEILTKIDNETQRWLHLGEGEKPVREVNYRPIKEGGLGIQQAEWKSRALVIKGAIKYGNEEEYVDRYEVTKMMLMGCFKTKQIYKVILDEQIGRKENRIKSRTEKKELWVRWDQTRKNMEIARGLNIQEKEFMWKLVNDMLRIGDRVHWGGDPNTRDKCKMISSDGSGNMKKCGEKENRRHVFDGCFYSRNKNRAIKEVLEEMTSREVSTTALIHIDIEHQSQKKRKEAVLFTVRAMRRIYLYREESLEDFKREVQRSFGKRNDDNITNMDEAIRAYLRDWG